MAVPKIPQGLFASGRALVLQSTACPRTADGGAAGTYTLNDEILVLPRIALPCACRIIAAYLTTASTTPNASGTIYAGLAKVGTTDSILGPTAVASAPDKDTTTATTLTTTTTATAWNISPQKALNTLAAGTVVYAFITGSNHENAFIDPVLTLVIEPVMGV